MSSEQWRPVSDGFTYRQPSYPVTSLTFHDNSLIISDRSTKQIVLPTDLRLCERVEDALISPAALQAAGWTEIPYSHILTKVYVPPCTIEVFQLQVAFNAEISRHRPFVRIVHPDDKRMTQIQHCRTMSQLAALIDMLTPAE